MSSKKKNTDKNPGCIAPRVFHIVAAMCIFLPKTIDNSLFYGKMYAICKDSAETKHRSFSSARGERCEPLVKPCASHFQVARDDRDGRSRYRAAKISPYGDN